MQKKMIDGTESFWDRLVPNLLYVGILLTAVYSQFFGSSIETEEQKQWRRFAKQNSTVVVVSVLRDGLTGREIVTVKGKDSNEIWTIIADTAYIQIASSVAEGQTLQVELTGRFHRLVPVGSQLKNL